MTPRRALTLAAALLVAVSLQPRAWAGEPADQLFAGIDRVLQVLEDPAMKPEAKAAERRAAIRRIASDIFDIDEISRRTLGRHWQPLTAAERAEFVQAFGDLLRRSYFMKIDGHSVEKIALVGEAIDDDQAIVRTTLKTRQGTQIPVDYHMTRNGDRWRAYDVGVAGVSLVANYRSQFERIIQRTSYQQLVKQVRERQ
ncbi:MAG: ABC transporter substrate-binding protein [candidate division NC10 bacterium]|jgi:phospholipid transport system substrate-binding protein